MSDNNGTENSKKKRLVLFICIAAALLVLIGVILAIVLSNKDAGNADSGPETTSEEPVFSVEPSGTEKEDPSETETEEPAGDTGHEDHCLCAGAGWCGNEDEKPEWTAVSGTLSTELLSAGGNFYLESDSVLEGQVIIGEGVTLNLCLAGHKLEAAPGKRAFLLSEPTSSLSVTDCSKEHTGSLTGTDGMENGGVIFAQKGKIQLYGIALSSSATEAQGSGGVLRVGNSATAQAEAVLYDCTVTNGAGKEGGNIYIGPAGSKVRIIGGSVTGGKAELNGGNIFLRDGSILEIDNAEIDGGIYVRAQDSTVVLSGAPVIASDGGGYGLSLPENFLLTVKSPLGEGAKISVTAAGTFAQEVSEGDASAFVLDKNVEGGTLVYENGELKVAMDKALVHMHCVCGGKGVCGAEGNELLYKEITGTIAADELKGGGNFCLVGPVVLSEQVKIGGNTTLNLCLNGQTLTSADGARAFLLTNDTAVLNITDCSKNGRGVITGNDTVDNGSVIMAQKGTVQLYGGTIRHAAAGTANGGGTMRIGNSKTATAVMNMYPAARIENGSAKQGGNLYIGVGSTVNIHGGTITGGSAESGANIYARENASLYIAGAKINGGIYVSSKDTSVTLAGSPVITGGTTNLKLPAECIITINGVLGSGAKIGISAAGTFASTATEENKTRFELDPGNEDAEIRYADSTLFIYREITHTHCACNGSGYCGAEEEKITFQKIAGAVNADDLKNGGSFYLEEDTVLSGQVSVGSDVKLNICLNGHTLSAADGKRAFLLTSDTAALAITDCSEGKTGTITGNDGADNGGIIFAQKGSVSLYHATVRYTGETGSKSGGVMRIGNSATAVASLRMADSTLLNGISGDEAATGGGGNLYIGPNSQAEIIGSTISGGSAVMNGDNVFIRGGATVEIRDTEIAGGVSLQDGTASVTLAGLVKINGAGEGKTNLLLPEETLLKVQDTLSAGSMILITANEGDFAIVSSADNQSFFSLDAGMGEGLAIGFNAETNALTVKKAGTEPEEPEKPEEPETVVDHGDHPAEDGWTPINGTVAAADLVSGGKYYLTGDVTLGAAKTIGADTEITICLNGHVLTAANNARAFLLTEDTSKLVIEDCMETTGTIQGNASANGTIIFAQKGTVELRKINVKYTGTANTASGGAIRIGNSSKATAALTMAGCTVTDGVSGAANEGTNAANNGGGNLYIGPGSSASIEGSKISGGSAVANGDNVFIRENASVTLKNTEIAGGVYVKDASATLTISGKTVISGAAEGAYNVSLPEGGLLVIDGTLSAGSLIGITAKTGAFAKTSKEENKAFFAMDTQLEGGEIVFSESEAVLKTVVSAGFRAGTAKTDITPEESVPLQGYGNVLQRMSDNTKDPLYASAIAVTDANDQTVLIFTVDLCTSEVAGPLIREAVSTATGIPVSNILVNASHTHSGPALSATSSEAIVRYRTLLQQKAVETAKRALDNRTVVTLETGSISITDQSFIRHYLLQDGTRVGYESMVTSANPAVGHVGELDAAMQLLRFKRAGEKDILLVNWQVHNTLTGGSSNYSISADIAGVIRNRLSEALDCEAVYLNGASGNINPKSLIDRENGSSDYKTRGKAVADQVIAAKETLFTAVEAGSIGIKTASVVLTIDHTEDGLIEAAREVQSVWTSTNDRAAADAAGAPYGIRSPYHANAIITRYSLPETETVEIGILSIGDRIAIAFVPYEMFSESGLRIKAASPYALTMISGYTNAHFGYMPVKSVFEYDAYERDVTRYVAGTAEKLEAKLIELLTGVPASDDPGADPVDETPDLRAVHNDHPAEDGWTAISGTVAADDLVSGGKYYLAADVTLGAVKQIAADTEITICLNGHTLTAADNARAFLLTQPTASLVIEDCAETPGTIQGNASGATNGTIIFAQKGTVELKNINVKYTGTTNTGSGGAIRIGNSATASASLTMIGCTVTGGISGAASGANNGGGNLYIGPKSSATIEWSKISGGSAVSYGDNLFIRDGATVTLTDTEIGGGVYVKDASATLKISGKTVITGAAEGLYNLSLPEGGLVLIDGTLSAGSLVGVTAKIGVFSGEVPEEYKPLFFADDAEYEVTYNAESHCLMLKNKEQ